MKILYVSPEIVPFAKTGGLADVAGSLPKALHDLGHDIRLIMPKYQMIDEKKFGLKKIIEKIEIKVMDRTEYADLYSAYLPGTKVPVYFVANSRYFDRPGIYQEQGRDYPDNCERFSFFCRAIMEIIPQLDFLPDIIHGNDWQSALVMAYLKKMYKWNGVASIYSIHNMDYFGLFPKEQIFYTGFGWEMFTPQYLEFYDQLALAKAGLGLADIISTVSPTYAKEIQTPAFGAGLDGLMRERKADLFGILNGIDYEVWNPATDKKLAKTYSADSLGGKLANKLALQKKNGLPQRKSAPLLGMISRLADQKGFDLLAGALEVLIDELKCQIVILGVGDLKYHNWLLEEKKKFPKNLGVNLRFDAIMAELIYAGADMFLMPSRYEPCGLGQIISFKYGTVPIVRRTGGLADTVREGKEGYIFEAPTPQAFLEAVNRAVSSYKNKKAWKAIQEHIMGLDYSWKASAKKYLDLYQKALRKIGRHGTI